MRRGSAVLVHWYRNIFSRVPSTKVREIAAMLKAIHASEDIVAAREKAVRVIEKLRALRLIRAAELVEKGVEKTLIYYAFPKEHCGVFERITHSSASCGRLDGVPVSSAHSPTDNRHSILPRPALLS